MKSIRLFLLLSLLPMLACAADYSYTLSWLSPNTHTYVVDMEVRSQTNDYTDVKIPAWRPGRYYEQNFAAGISHFEAFDANGEALTWTKVDKDTWRVLHPRQPGQVKVRYRYYANNEDSGSSYYDDSHLYFNPANLFMYVPGRYDGEVELHIPDLPADWKMASALTRLDDQRTFTSSSYHDFIDSPTILAEEMIQRSFEDDGTTIYLHFHGPVVDRSEETLAAVEDMVKRVAQTQAAIFGGYPFEEFHFLYRLMPFNIGHGVEHKFSTVISVPATITESKDQFVRRLQGLTAHELWHAWNVKRIRPAAMWPYDYGVAQYTTLHWFTEGVTSYYTQLTLVRAGLITPEQFWNGMAGTIGSMENNYASTVVSPSMSSFNSWLTGSAYDHPDHQISYYTQGNWLGLLIDLELRARTDNRLSLDDVFRYLWEKYYLQSQGVPEDGVQEALETLSDGSWDEFFDAYVHGVAPVDYEAFFDPFGLELQQSEEEDPGLRGLGILRYDQIAQGVLVRRVHPGGDAYAAGIGADQLIVEIDGQSAAELDVDEYVNNLRRGQFIDMKVLVNFRTLQDVQVEYEGSYVPSRFEIVPKSRQKPQQQAWLEAWLES